MNAQNAQVLWQEYQHLLHPRVRRGDGCTYDYELRMIPRYVCVKCNTDDRIEKITCVECKGVYLICLGCNDDSLRECASCHEKEWRCRAHSADNDKQRGVHCERCQCFMRLCDICVSRTEKCYKCQKPFTCCSECYIDNYLRCTTCYSGKN
jgi:hypothetical protein